MVGVFEMLVWYLITALHVYLDFKPETKEEIRRRYEEKPGDLEKRLNKCEEKKDYRGIREIGTSYQAIGEYDNALSAFEKHANATGEYRRVIEIGNQFKREGNLEKALEAYNKVPNWYSDCRYQKLAIANDYIEQDKFKEAIELAKELRMNSLLLRIGKLASEKQDYETAEQAFKAGDYHTTLDRLKRRLQEAA